MTKYKIFVIFVLTNSLTIDRNKIKTFIYQLTSMEGGRKTIVMYKSLLLKLLKAISS